MNPFLKTFSFLLCLTSFISCNSIGGFPGLNGSQPQDENTPRTVTNFGEDWQFQRLDDPNIVGPNWEVVNLPHTTKIEPLVVNDQWQGTSVYRKEFEVENPVNEKWFFEFEGVMQEARVKINDSLVKIHKGGYLPFIIDATDCLIKNATNTIEVEVINTDDPTIPPGKPLSTLDFNLYGGIYRNVYLIKTNETYITDPVHAKKVNGGGILVHFDDISETKASGFVKTHVRNDSEEVKDVKIRATLTSENGKTYKFTSREESIQPGGDISVEQDISLEYPQLWSPQFPSLYELKVEVVDGEEVVDAKEITTGIREIELTGDALYLNGKELYLYGTNRHQEYPYVGYALSDEANYRDAYKIKEAGFNFVRLSHYPHSTSFMKAADELGLIVMNAIPGWQFYEDGEFAENAIQDIKDMVRRDRNHPSVVFWENSLNESRMPEAFMIRANEVLKDELPYDDTYSAGWIDHESYDLFIPARQHAKPPLYWNEYNKPDRPILIAEYGDWEYYAQNAGFNQTAFSDLQEEERSSRQLRSAGEARLLQQALNYQESMNSNLRGEQTIGMSNWLMFDYNRGYAEDLESSGISDIFRIPKFSFYFYKSQKEPLPGKFSGPMVFIASYWTEDSSTDVKVFSNTEEVALYLNGELIEKKEPEITEISDELPYPPFVFELEKFEAGELKAVGYIDGEEVASYQVSTPGNASRIDLALDHSGRSIATNTPDVVFIYAIIRDENGTVVPDAENVVTFTLDGNEEEAELIGGPSVKAEAGIATILLRTNTFTKDIVVKASSENLGETQIKIND